MTISSVVEKVRTSLLQDLSLVSREFRKIVFLHRTLCELVVGGILVLQEREKK